VSLDFNDEGGELFKEITERNVGLPVAIYLDGVIIQEATVNQTISNGRAQISGGNFMRDEGRLLMQRLNAGALPGVWNGTLHLEEWIVRYPCQIEVNRLSGR